MGVDSTDLKSGKGLILHRSLPGHGGPINRFGWSPDGTKIATPSHDHTIVIWDVETGPTMHVCRTADEPVWSVAWAPDGKSVATGHDNGAVTIWDASSGQCVKTVRSQQQAIFGLAWSPDSTLLVSSSRD